VKRSDFASNKKIARPPEVVAKIERASESFPPGTRLRIQRDEEVISPTLHDITVVGKEKGIYIVRSVGFGNKEHGLKLADMERLYRG